MQAGAVAFLDKPFNDEQLLENIRSALKQRNSESGIDNVKALQDTVTGPTPADSAEATLKRSPRSCVSFTLPVAGGSPS